MRFVYLFLLKWSKSHIQNKLYVFNYDEWPLFAMNFDSYTRWKWCQSKRNHVSLIILILFIWCNIMAEKLMSTCSHNWSLRLHISRCGDYLHFKYSITRLYIYPHIESTLIVQMHTKYKILFRLFFSLFCCCSCEFVDLFIILINMLNIC